MNYFKRIFIALVLLLSVVAVYAGGIKDAKDLVAFVTAINKGEDYSAFKNDKGAICLEADIDMAKVKKFASVKSFGGVFDGQGFALKNWKAQSALFHEILEGGKVCNLRIDASCVMKAQSKGGEYFLGWIADINSGTIENCENHGALIHKSNYTDGNVYVGGIVGIDTTDIHNAYSYCTITAIDFEDSHSTSSKNALGMITGSASAEGLSKCYAGGEIIATQVEDGEDASGDGAIINTPGVLNVSNYAAWLSGDHTVTSETAKSQSCGYISSITATPQYAN